MNGYTKRIGKIDTMEMVYFITLVLSILCAADADALDALFITAEILDAALK